MKLQQSNDGVWAKIDNGATATNLCGKYHRNPGAVCAKVFYKEKATSLDMYNWGGGWGVNIVDATRFQNVCAMAGLAPRVYALEVIANRVVQLTDFVKGTAKKDSELVEQIIALNKQNNGYINEAGCIYSKSAINGKWVDFQEFGLTKEAYRETVKTLLQEHVTGFLYQSVPEIELEGHRNTQERVKDFGLDTIDFKNKKVLDIGCSNGQFCNYVASRGGYAIGLDTPNVVVAAKHLSNYLGYYNNDFYGVDLLTMTKDDIKNLTGFDEFDYVFFFSMITHVGFADWIPSITKAIIYEKSGGAIAENKLQQEEIAFKKFTNITYLGKSRDQNRDIYHLLK